MRHFHQELAYFAVHHRKGCVLWCDGEHGFNPYDFAELNLERGFEAEWGAERVLVKRCMTPFQWDTVLTVHLDQKLVEAEAALVLAAPFDGLFFTDELQDWEREDYVDFSLKHLKGLAAEHRVPILISVDMSQWCRTYPLLAWRAYEAAGARWAIRKTATGWSATPTGSGADALSEPRRQLTLADFSVPTAPPLLVSVPARTARSPPVAAR
jgi:hypothetical protein